jgi:hypothetical protein
MEELPNKFAQLTQEFNEYRDASKREILKLSGFLAQSEKAFSQLQSEFKSVADHANTPRVSTPRISPPSRYTGGYKVDIAAWLFEVDNFMEATGVTSDKQQFATIVALLGGSAAKWWQINKQTYADIDYAEFRELLVKQFSVIDRERSARDQIYKLKQVGSVKQYSNAFRTLILEIPLMNEFDKVDRYIRGLKDKNVRAQVLLKKPTTLEEAIQFSETLDSVYFSIQGSGGVIPQGHGNSAEPMDLDQMQIARTPFKRLTPEEKKALRDSGGCVYCRASNHPVETSPKLANKNKKKSGNFRRD